MRRAITKQRGMRLRPPVHFGEDWNGKGGGDSDLGDPIYAIADGVVMFAYDCRGGWGPCILLRHVYRDPRNQKGQIYRLSVCSLKKHYRKKRRLREARTADWHLGE